MTLPEGLYAITPDWADSARLVTSVSAVLQGGARIVQYRNKLADATLRHEQASALLALCRTAQVPLIINDHLDLALAIDADGLHLGGDDGDITAARTALGPHKLLGASCYNRLELAQAALAAGADHVGFGAAFVSGTKPDAVRADAELYRQACATLRAPVVAIGGITVGNGSTLIDCGVRRLAVIGGLFDADDVSARAARFAALF